MQGGNKLRRGDLTTGEGAGAVVPIGGQKGTYIVSLGQSWSTVTGQKIPSQVQAGGCWWVGTQEWSAGSQLPASGVCIRGLRWGGHRRGASPELTKAKCALLDVLQDEGEKRETDSTRTWKSRPFFLQCPSSAFYWANTMTVAKEKCWRAQPTIAQLKKDGLWSWEAMDW